jgi:hypothetical protein
MKAKLIFDLPEETDSFNNAVSGNDMYLCIYEFDQFLRDKIKYADLSEEQYKVYESIREEFRNKLIENKIFL